MKIIKLAVFSIVTLFLLITCIGLLFPSRVTVLRRATISAPEDSVYAMLSDMRNWDQWLFDSTHPIKMLSPKSVGNGAKAMVGHNIIVIRKTTPTLIQSVWKAGNTNDQLCTWQISKDNTTPGTLVQWSFQQHLNWYPWERVGAILNEKILGPSMDSSFARLRRRLQP